MTPKRSLIPALILLALVIIGLLCFRCDGTGGTVATPAESLHMSHTNPDTFYLLIVLNGDTVANYQNLSREQYYSFLLYNPNPNNPLKIER